MELQQIKYLEYYGYYNYITYDKSRNKEIKETLSYRPCKIRILKN